MHFPTSLQKKEAAKRNKDQFEVGDTVTIAHRFFSNRGLKFLDLGKAEITSIVQPVDFTPPSVRIRIKFNAALIQYAKNGYVKIFGAYGLNEKGEPTAIVEIHPVYLEHVKAKRKKK